MAEHVLRRRVYQVGDTVRLVVRCERCGCYARADQPASDPDRDWLTIPEGIDCLLPGDIRRMAKEQETQ